MANEDSVKEWFKYAKRDLDTANYLVINMWPKPLEIACFLCQQAAEKFIKAVIISNGDDPPKIHDLLRLCKMLESKVETSPIASECTYLTPFAVASRYPYGPEVDEPQTHLALTCAERVKEWALSLVQLDEEEGTGTGQRTEEQRIKEARDDK